MELIEQALAQPGATPESVDMDLIQSQLDARNMQVHFRLYINVSITVCGSPSSDSNCDSNTRPYEVEQSSTATN